MNNIFFWTGEENFLIHEKKSLWEKEFIKKHGDFNILNLDTNSTDFSEINTYLKIPPLLGSKRLIFIKNITSIKKKVNENSLNNFLETINNTDQNTIIIFMETKPDKRNVIYKKLVKLAKLEEFNKLSHNQLLSWVKNKIAANNSKILPSAIPYLLEFTNNNLWGLNNEINKLVSYTNNNKPISENDIDKVVISSVSTNVFYLLDAISEKNTKNAIKELNNIFQEGDNLIQVFNLIIKHFRSFILAASYVDNKKEKLIKEFKIHPFTAQKIIKYLKNFSISELKLIYQHLLEIDLKIKTGVIDLSGNNFKLLVLEIEKLLLKNYMRSIQNK